MKKVIYLSLLFFLFTRLQAQQWSGSGTTSGSIYREGNIGLGVSNPSSLFELGNNQWMKFHARSTQSGILFYETGKHTSSSVQYGAKLYYDEDKDMLKISTVNAGNENVGLCFRRTYPRVGIGNFTKDRHLAAALNIKGSQNSAQLEIGNTNANNGNYILSYDRITNGYRNLVFRTTPEPTLALLTNGNVGIGTYTPEYKLDVDGQIRAEEIIIENVGADFVFEPDYDLKSLAEVEEHINNHGHLPGVDPAHVTEKGIKLGEFNEVLLQKIEELTLYIIEQQKEIEALKVKLNQE